MEIKIFDSEIKIMELIWEHKEISAKDLSLIANEKLGWNKNTTYTVLKKLETKGYIKRSDPNYICTPLISRNEVQSSETKSLVKRLFGGSKKALFSALLEDETLTQKDIDELRELIEKR
ncbi:MAG: BlaI/MecI/CopY family transcriptional regulator [Oscillospiraceae bacterium]|nr:BlaI/MecI/CopY family transcriptional regulator [Oscillospiraceae bacterium]